MVRSSCACGLPGSRPSARGSSACSTTPRSSNHPPSARSSRRGSPRSSTAAAGPTGRPRRRSAARRTSGGGGSTAAGRIPGRETSQRLRRLLAVVGWLAQVGEAPIADAARRFGMDEDELISELELAACCGVPPYTPDTLMEIEVSETSVRAFLPPEFARPRRLTPAEGFAVAASARLIMAVPGPDDGALAPRPVQARSGLGIARRSGWTSTPRRPSPPCAEPARPVSWWRSTITRPPATSRPRGSSNRSR